MDDKDHDLLIKLNQCVMSFRDEVNKKLDQINCDQQQNQCAAKFLTVDRHNEIEKQKSRSLKYMATIIGIMLTLLTIMSFFRIDINYHQDHSQKEKTNVTEGHQPSQK